VVADNGDVFVDGITKILQFYELRFYYSLLVNTNTKR